MKLQKTILLILTISMVLDFYSSYKVHKFSVYSPNDQKIKQLEKEFQAKERPTPLSPLEIEKMKKDMRVVVEGIRLFREQATTPEMLDRTKDYAKDNKQWNEKDSRSLLHAGYAASGKMHVFGKEFISQVASSYLLAYTSAKNPNGMYTFLFAIIGKLTNENQLDSSIIEPAILVKACVPASTSEHTFLTLTCPWTECKRTYDEDTICPEMKLPQDLHVTAINSA